jgi:alpha-glucosidase (family GH31 glycosyl hydrolase)
MYHEFPTSPLAFASLTREPSRLCQYMLGDSVISAPVISPWPAEKQIWLPAGDWFSVPDFAVVRGGEEVVVGRTFDVSEVPLYLKAGAVIPLRKIRGMKKHSVFYV